MTYRTLMTYLQAGAANEGVLSITAALVERFGARVIGVSACQPVNPLYEEGFGAGNVVEDDRAEINSELTACEGAFRAALEGNAKGLEWRSAITYGPLDDYIADQARAADLIIIGKPCGGSFFDQTRCVDVGALVMQAGRPVLLVPEKITALALQHVIVGWKETREARRAIRDALPLLEAAGYATILEAAGPGQQGLAHRRLEDVSAWLKQHDVEAAPLVIEAKGSDSGLLRGELVARGCDLLIAGAYGHSRLRQWTFGGVTQDLLLDPDCCVLLSH